MAFGSVQLIPGINVERTPMLLRAGFSQSQFIRFRDGQVQKLGGWQSFYPIQTVGVPRELHAWEDLDKLLHLVVASAGPADLLNIVNGIGATIIPQTLTTNPATTSFSTTINLPVVGITDTGITNPTLYDAVYFNTPVSIGGLILDGLYPITEITGTNSYQITVPTDATATATSGAVPQFTTTSGSEIVKVTFPNHGITETGEIVSFVLSTSGNGVTIFGGYKVTSIIDANNFDINVSTQATSNGSFFQNSGNAQLVYYIALGPPPAGSGYGLGPYGAGGYGLGSGGGSGPATGSPINPVDWTIDNWGEILLEGPQDMPLFYWQPESGFQNSQIIVTAPPINRGMFVSMGEQIMVAYGSSIHQAIGWQQQPLLVQWSDAGNFFQWTPASTNQAGNFTIPTGSRIMGGLAAPNQNLIWTDLDLWAMNYIGQPFIFGFNKIGAGLGAVSAQCMQQLRGSIFWMTETNFAYYSGGGADVLPCPVWDAVFQNLNTDYLQNIRSMPNTEFNEVGWLYPSAASTSGECDSYVKFNITEQGTPWDYGSWTPTGANRSAWMDQSVLGPPIAATSGGTIYQHETSQDAAGQPLVASFTTGFFYLQDGEDFVVVDQVLPDFKWTLFPGGSSATITLYFNVVNYPGDTPNVYGPYVVTQATEFVSVRFRGRLMSITVQSKDLGSFWRLGSVKYRYWPAGRR